MFARFGALIFGVNRIARHWRSLDDDSLYLAILITCLGRSMVGCLMNIVGIAPSRFLLIYFIILPRN